MFNALKKWLFYRPPKKIVVMNGSCQKCGGCCRNMNIFDAGRWVTKESHFKKMIAEKPEYARLHITGKNSNGTLNFKCSWLTPQNTCKDYENRLDFCKTFPNKLAISKEGILHKGCGYSIRVHSSFDSVLKKTVRRQRFRTMQQWMTLTLKKIIFRK